MLIYEHVASWAVSAESLGVPLTSKWEHLAGRPSLGKVFVTALVKISNNDRKPLSKPVPLRGVGGRHFDRVPGVEIICIDYVTLLLQRANP